VLVGDPGNICRGPRYVLARPVGSEFRLVCADCRRGRPASGRTYLLGTPVVLVGHPGRRPPDPGDDARFPGPGTLRPSCDLGASGVTKGRSRPCPRVRSRARPRVRYWGPAGSLEVRGGGSTREGGSRRGVPGVRVAIGRRGAGTRARPCGPLAEGGRRDTHRDRGRQALRSHPRASRENTRAGCCQSGKNRPVNDGVRCERVSRHPRRAGSTPHNPSIAGSRVCTPFGPFLRALFGRFSEPPALVLWALKRSRPLKVSCKHRSC
jgi:hypothetical protein